MDRIVALIARLRADAHNETGSLALYARELLAELDLALAEALAELYKQAATQSKRKLQAANEFSFLGVGHHGGREAELRLMITRLTQVLPPKYRERS